MEDEVKTWITFAETDLGVAKHLYENYFPIPFEVSVIITNKLLKKLLKL